MIIFKNGVKFEALRDTFSDTSYSLFLITSGYKRFLHRCMSVHDLMGEAEIYSKDELIQAQLSGELDLRHRCVC